MNCSWFKNNSLHALCRGGFCGTNQYEMLYHWTEDNTAIEINWVQTHTSADGVILNLQS